MKEIKEYQALLALMQTYQSKMSMLYSASIAIAIGLFIVPLFALNSSLNLSPTQIFGLKERLICFALTLTLAVAAFHWTSKTIFLGALQWEGVMRLDVMDKEKSLMEYHGEMEVELRGKYPIFKKYKMYKSELSTKKPL